MTTSNPQPRSLSVDALRLLAAFGVILIHLAPSTNSAEVLTQLFSLFAVPFFFAVSLYFFINRIAALPAISLAELRLERILVPCAVWTAAYTLLKFAKYRLRGEMPGIDIIDTVFYGGAAVHLYFLPKLVYFQLLALSAILLPRAARNRVAGLWIALAAIGYGAIGERFHYFGFGDALAEGFLYVAAAFLLVRTQASASGRRINSMLGRATILLIFLTACLGYPLKMLGVWEGPIVGYTITALALNWQLTAALSPLPRAVLTCSYGIYLAHFAFLEALELALAKSGHPLTPYTVVTKLALGLAIALGCVIFTLAARQDRFAACMFLGETPASPNRPARN